MTRLAILAFIVLGACDPHAFKASSIASTTMDELLPEGCKRVVDQRGAWRVCE